MSPPNRGTVCTRCRHPRPLHKDGGVCKAKAGKLPAQLDLAKTYGVSRETVTKALAELKAEGLVTAVRSRGNIVTYKLPA